MQRAFQRKLRNAASVPRQSSRPRAQARTVQKTRPIQPVPPAAPKPKLAFNRKLFQKVNKNIQQLSAGKQENISADQTPGAFVINLEDLVLLEGCLAGFLEGLYSNEECLLICEEWTEITADNTLNKVETLFRNEKVKLNVRSCMILGKLMFELLRYLAYSGQLSCEAVTAFKSVVFNYQQSFLLFTHFVTSRIPSGAQNSWVSELTSLRQQKCTQEHWEEDPLGTLRGYNATVKRLLVRTANALRCDDRLGRGLKTVLLRLLKALPHVTQPECSDALESAFGIQKEVAPPRPQPPFLPTNSAQRYCLVMDLDETLVHFIEETEQVLVRPYAVQFLQTVARAYEVVVFTASVQSYADSTLDGLPGAECVSHRLYRQHTVQAGSFFAKDLKLLGRDLAKTIIVDNTPENFQFQPENGIYIRSWLGEPDDTALEELAAVLLTIASEGVEDVRARLKTFRDQLLREKEPRLSLDSDRKSR